MKRKGTQLLLAPGTRIPCWIANQDLSVSVALGENVSVALGEKDGVYRKHIKILSVRGGEAMFGADGVVWVKMPGSSKWRSGFAPRKVLKILDLSGKVLARNWFFCEKCVANSGEIVGEPRPRPEPASRCDATFACETPECGNSWKLVI